MKVFFSLLFLLPSVIQDRDTLVTNQLCTNKDTIVVNEEETHKVFITNSPSFLEEYGTIIGSLLAALIAYGSIN